MNQPIQAVTTRSIFKTWWPLAASWMLMALELPAINIVITRLVNPEIHFPEEDATDVMEEGCLSFPGVNGDVVRPDRVIVHYQDTMGGAHTLEASGLISRCIQHEVDHLNGVLFIDRMKKDSLKKIKKALGKMKKH